MSALAPPNSRPQQRIRLYSSTHLDDSLSLFTTHGRFKLCKVWMIMVGSEIVIVAEVDGCRVAYGGALRSRWFEVVLFVV